MMRRLLLAAMALAAAPALAQPYPSKPVRLVVPFPPGGPVDIVARPLAAKLATVLGQPVVIDNRSGAGGVVGIDHVAKSAGDGYTLLLTPPGGLIVAPFLLATPPYDPFKDLVAVSEVVTVPAVIAANPKVGARTLPELVAYAKANPGKVNFASSGSATMAHLAGELLKRDAGIDIVHVPYRGAAPGVQALLAGDVQIRVSDVPTVLPHIKAGKLVAIAVSSKQRVPALPGVPTTAEAGMPTLVAENWYGLLAPAGTPRDVVAKIQQAVATALKAPDLQEQLAAQGAEPVGSTPGEFATYMRAESAKWGTLAKAVGAKIE